MHSKYFEGTLQLRNQTEEIEKFVLSEIKKKDNVWIAKTTDLKNGVDLDLSSNKFLLDIGRKLKNRFPGVLKKSSTLYSVNKQTSKEVHRGCILFRYVDIKKGDKITYRGDEAEVLYFGKDVTIRVNNRKRHISFEELI